MKIICTNGSFYYENWTRLLRHIVYFTAMDGGWTEFADWSECSVTCGNGVQVGFAEKERERWCITG